MVFATAASSATTAGEDSGAANAAPIIDDTGSCETTEAASATSGVFHAAHALKVASTGSAAATPAISPTTLLSAAHTPAMAEAAQAAAAAAATQFFTKAPTFSGASGFRVYKTELKIWLRMTTVAANKQAPTMLAALTGSAKRLAGTLAIDKFFQDDGAAQLLAVL